MSIRTLVVDDSLTMQALLSRELSAAQDIAVVGTARNAEEARAKVKELNPDVVTLDIEMGGMSGLEFLKRLMRLRPTPVVMVSSFTREGAEASLTALELGAIGCYDKRMLERAPNAASSALPDLIRSAARASSAPGFGRVHQATGTVATGYVPRPESMIAIGVSTGGVETLIEMIGAFPPNCPPAVIVQHMPASFTASFADRLNRLCPPRVEEARSGSKLVPGTIFVAPGGEHHLEIAGEATRRHCRLVKDDKVSGHRPSVDRLFHSVARWAGNTAVGLILTGMGRDGADGLNTMRTAGAMTLGQDEATSVVFGMPAAAFDCGAVTEQLPLRDIGKRALEWCRA